MDPDIALAAMRELSERGIRSRSPVASQLAEQFGALDDWLSGGGFVPAAWRDRPTPYTANGFRKGRPVDPEPGVVLDGVEHGTTAGYYAGCRCLECRAANRERTAKYRAQRREQS